MQFLIAATNVTIMIEPLRQPLTSIALCTYNGERYLREQLDSLMAQTCRDFEIIAVDDASTDATVAILRDYAARDARIHIVVNPVNLGFRKNFEHAMSLCTGRFIAPCDQDDVWLPEKLAVLLDTIGDHAAAYCDSEFVDEHGQPLNDAMSRHVVLLSTSDPAVFAAGNCVSGHAMLFRRELVVRALPIPDCFYYDWWLAAVAASEGGVIACTSQLVKYRLHGNNVTNILRTRPPQRQPGYRWKGLHDFRLRLQCLVGLPGGSRAFIAQWRDLWVARETQWLSLTLAAFVFRHAPRIFAIHKWQRSRLKYAIKYVFGLRLKRMTNPYGYNAAP